jgi:hypothetical protein
VHPTILESYLNENLMKANAHSDKKKKRFRGLHAQEVVVLDILERCT